jgi:hypothetical protein
MDGCIAATEYRFSQWPPALRSCPVPPGHSDDEKPHGVRDGVAPKN